MTFKLLGINPKLQLRVKAKLGLLVPSIDYFNNILFI